MTIQQAWDKRREMYTEGNKLFAEGNKLYAEGNKLHAEGNKLHAEGDLVFINAILVIHGDVVIKWEGNDCAVCGVKYFREPPAPAPCDGKVVEIDGKKYKLTEVK